MKLSAELRDRIVQRFGRTIDLQVNPQVLQQIVDEIEATGGSGSGSGQDATAPFNVSWMDSWVAHWIYHDKQRTLGTQQREAAAVLKSLVDLKFNERIGEIQRFIRDFPHAVEPPDGGPPEPGTPPVGPAAFTPPDGGPPEPGTPPAGPQGMEPPDGGPPEPGVPPTGPDAGFMRENPWILYWFISIKASLLLDVVDAHMTRRLNELRAGAKTG